MGTRRRAAIYLAASVAGVVAAHAADYVAVFPHAGTRDVELAATGHGYWPTAVMFASVAALALLGAAVWNGLRSSTAPVAQLALSPRRLALFQLVLFSAVEVGERVPAGVDLTTLAGSPEFLLGLVLQVVVAFTICRLTLAVEELAGRIAGATRRAPFGGGRRPLVPRRDDRGPARLLLATPLGSRAPPSTLFT